MSALTPFVGTPQFRQIENFFNALTEDRKLLFSNSEAYPPYSAWFEEEGACKIEIAVAGFTKEDLTITFDGQFLTIKGEKSISSEDSEKEEKRNWIKRGLARRAFVRRFEMRGTYSLESASLKNGILTVTLKEELKKIGIDIIEE